MSESASTQARAGPAAIVGCWSTTPDNLAAPSESYGADGSYQRISLSGITHGTYSAAADDRSVTIHVGSQALVYETTFESDSVTFTHAGESSTYRSIPCR